MSATTISSILSLPPLTSHRRRAHLCRTTTAPSPTPQLLPPSAAVVVGVLLLLFCCCSTIILSVEATVHRSPTVDMNDDGHSLQQQGHHEGDGGDCPLHDHGRALEHHDHYHYEVGSEEEGEGSQPQQQRFLQLQEPWVAQWTTTAAANGEAKEGEVEGMPEQQQQHEEPLIFSSPDGSLKYLTWFNYQHAMRTLLTQQGNRSSSRRNGGCEAWLVFYYHQGCGLCEEVYPSLVDVAKQLSTTTAAAARPKKVAEEGEMDWRVCVAQFDATIEPNATPACTNPDHHHHHDHHAEGVRSILQSQGPNRTAIVDFPTVTVVIKTKNNRLQLLANTANHSAANEGGAVVVAVEGFTGPLTVKGVRNFLSARQKDGEAESPTTPTSVEESDGGAFAFDNGILVI